MCRALGARGHRRLVLAVIVAAAVSGRSLVAARGAPPIVPARYVDLAWRCIGPFDGGPVASVAGVAGVPGVYVLTTPSGGVWKTTDGGGTWASIDRADIAPDSDPHRWVDPANPRRIVRTEAQGIAVSLDAGATWTSFHHLPIASLAHLASHTHAVEPAGRRHITGETVRVSIADPARAGLVFAGTDEAVFVSLDAGAHWAPLRLNMPRARITDLDIRGVDLVAATDGRSVWSLDDIAPLRQIGAATASASAILFAPPEARLATTDAAAGTSAGVYLDYYLGSAASNGVALEVTDAGGRVVHAASSAAPDSTDRWLAVTRPLPSSAGPHRVRWALRVDAPPAPHHRFAQLAPAVLADVPPDPDGPLVPPGTYHVRLTVGGAVYTQPLLVGSDAPPAAIDAARQAFGLAMQAYEAMVVSHRGFQQLARLRAGVRPLLASSDPDLAAAATELDARLAAIDGSDWTGLVIPDADNGADESEEDAKEGKHPDFVPPAPVSLTKDYDDPTSILGRAFENVAPAPAFAIISTRLGDLLTRLGAARAAPDQLATDTWARGCADLAGVLEAWRAINAVDLLRLNAELAARQQPALPVATDLPSIACSAAGGQ